MSSRSIARVAAALISAAALAATLSQSNAQEGPSINGTMTMLAESEHDDTMLRAIREGDEDKVRVLLAAYQRDGRALPVDHYDGTLLHMAASRSSEPILQMLLAAGLSPHVTTRGGAAPLHHAARANQPRMIMILLAAGADINARTKYGLTPLHLSIGTTQLLLAAGADPMARDAKGETAIFFGGPDVVALQSAGLDVNDRNTAGWTPLHVAAFHARTDHARQLLDHGADIEARTRVELVIRSDESWGSQERTMPAGYTALDIAYNEHDRVKWVTGRNRPMIDLLRERGAKRPFLGLRFLSW